MFTLVVAHRLGLESDLTLWLSVLEGICLTVVLMLLVERYLFSTGIIVSRAPLVRKAAEMSAATAAAEVRSAARPGTQI